MVLFSPCFKWPPYVWYYSFKWRHGGLWGVGDLCHFANRRSKKYEHKYICFSALVKRPWGEFFFFMWKHYPFLSIFFQTEEVHIYSQYSFHLTPCSYLYISVTSDKARVINNPSHKNVLPKQKPLAGKHSRSRSFMSHECLTHTRDRPSSLLQLYNALLYCWLWVSLPHTLLPLPVQPNPMSFYVTCTTSSGSLCSLSLHGLSWSPFSSRSFASLGWFTNYWLYETRRMEKLKK